MEGGGREGDADRLEGRKGKSDELGSKELLTFSLLNLLESPFLNLDDQVKAAHHLQLENCPVLDELKVERERNATRRIESSRILFS